MASEHNGRPTVESKVGFLFPANQGLIFAPRHLDARNVAGKIPGDVGHDHDQDKPENPDHAGLLPKHPDREPGHQNPGGKRCEKAPIPCHLAGSDQGRRKQ